MKTEKKNLRRISIVVTAQTKGNLGRLAAVCGYSEIGRVVDAVTVIHCRDCKHKGWVQEPCHGKSIDYCRVYDCTLRDLETNFCSYGERKNADENGSR